MSAQMSSPAQPDFDLIARPYRWLEYLTFGRALERCRLHYLPRLTHHRRALVLGDGDGRFLAALLAANPHLEATAIDISPAMLRLLEQRAHAAHPTAASRLRTVSANALSLDLPPTQTFDLVFTHFFLYCFTRAELDQLCARILPHLAPGATWVLSDFHVPPGSMRLPARALVRSLYLGFRLFTGLRVTNLPDHTAALTRIGLRRVDCRYSLAGILTAELWQLSPSSTHPISQASATGSKLSAMLPPQRTPADRGPNDPVPNPEPASPSLPGPDPDVYHHEPTPPPTPAKNS